MFKSGLLDLVMDRTEWAPSDGIAALQKVASCPNDSASKLAACALRTLGEDIPHHLSQQVPLWTVNDVFTWVDRVAEFPEYAQVGY